MRLTGRPTEKACPPPPLRPSKSGVAARRKPTTGSPEAVRVAAGSSFLSHRFPCRAVTTVAVAVVLLSPPPPQLCRCRRRPVCCSGGCLCSGPSWCVFWTAFRFEECLEKTTEIMGLHYVFLWITFFFKLLCSVCLLFSEKSVWKRIQKLYIVSIFVKRFLVSDVGLIFFSHNRHLAIFTSIHYKFCLILRTAYAQSTMHAHYILTKFSQNNNKHN